MIETTPTSTTHDDHHHEKAMSMMNTPQYLNYFSTTASSSQDMLSSPIATKSSKLYEDPSASTITSSSNSKSMMNMALTMLLLSPSKQNSSLLHTPTKTASSSALHHVNSETMNYSSCSPSSLLDTPRGSSYSNMMVRRTLDFDESMDNYEEVSLLDSSSSHVIKNSHQNITEDKIGLESNIVSNVNYFGESLVVSYFHRLMALLLAVLLFPTNMIKKEIQSSVTNTPSTVVERNSTHPSQHHSIEKNPMLDHYINKIDQQQERINELESIIKRMSHQIEDIVNSKEALEKRMNHVEEKQKESLPPPQAIESVDSNVETETPKEEEISSTLSNEKDLESIPNTTNSTESVLLFVLIPILITFVSIV